MYRTDHAHQWGRTEFAPMSAAYAVTLFDDGGMLMTGSTRPADIDDEKDAVYIRPLTAPLDPVDINTDSIPLDQIEARIAPQRRPYIPAGIDAQGRQQSGVRAQTEAERAAEIRAAQRAGAGVAWHASTPMPLKESAGDVAWRIAGEVVGWVGAGALVYAVFKLVKFLFMGAA